MTRRPRLKARRRAPARRTRSPARLVLTALAVLALAAAALLAFAVWGRGPGGPRARTVVIHPGEGVQDIAADLARAGVIRSPLAFIIVAEASGAGHALKAGEYVFPAGRSLAAVLDQIRRGAVVRHFVTIPEGLSSIAVADVLAADPVLVGPAPVPPEGSILPDTYEVRWGEAREDVEGRMRRARDQLVAQLWQDRPPGLPYRSPQDAVTVASIVEKETAAPQERAHVAGVYLNRLRLGMRLASDPAVIYGLTQGRPLGHGLTVSELAYVTPYNTYRLAGLPPTPIANPGRSSLIAAFNPARTEDLYFVADGTGGHAFAANLADHERNVARWRAIERANAAKAPT